MCGEERFRNVRAGSRNSVRMRCCEFSRRCNVMFGRSTPTEMEESQRRHTALIPKQLSLIIKESSMPLVRIDLPESIDANSQRPVQGARRVLFLLRSPDVQLGAQRLPLVSCHRHRAECAAFRIDSADEAGPSSFDDLSPLPSGAQITPAVCPRARPPCEFGVGLPEAHRRAPTGRQRPARQGVLRGLPRR